MPHFPPVQSRPPDPADLAKPDRFAGVLRSLAKPRSTLWIADDAGGWSLSWDARAVYGLAKLLGIRTVLGRPYGVFGQCVFTLDKYFLRDPKRMFRGGNRIALPYYHGDPAAGDPIQVACFEGLVRNHSRLSRIQVTHGHMRDVVLSSGIDPAKVHTIRIGIEPAFFPPVDAATRRAARAAVGLPESAVVVGSFQKDGEGWEEGLAPKWIKGPDVFLEIIRILKDRVPELVVLLSGPARGYVKNGLAKLGVPSIHRFAKDYPELASLYHCLDLYIVASREEGGPKAVLEAMSTGVPLVSTRVGQATELITPGENGFLAPVGDAEASADHALRILDDSGLRERLVRAGLDTAAKNAYAAQLPLWRDFFKGFVHFRRG